MCSSEDITNSNTILWDHQRPRLDVINTCSLLFYFYFFPQHDSIIFVPAEISSWPSSKILFLLRLWSMIFPCSDFRHVVMTPAILLMCEYLMRCPIVSGRDSAIGSFLCSMLLSVCINLFAISSFSIVSTFYLWNFLITRFVEESWLVPHKHYFYHHMYVILNSKVLKPWQFIDLESAWIGGHGLLI